MILYHGTNILFREIDLEKSNPFKDFGKGFYLTSIEEQARTMAEKKVRLLRGNPIVLKFDFDEEQLKNKEFNVLLFEKPSEEWADFIFKNRSRQEHFSHNYDIVYGPIADDGVAYLLDQYADGHISLKDLSKELEWKNLNNQYYFGTERAIKLLKPIYE